MTVLYAGLDLSRNRVDLHLLDLSGKTIEVSAWSPDEDGLAHMARHVRTSYGRPVRAAVESMNGARFVHDILEMADWKVELADAQKVKGLAPLACKTDKIDSWVLAELCRRDLVPAIWLPTPGIRAERERARFRMHLVKHRSSLKNRVHSTLISFGHPCPVSDLFGTQGRQRLSAMGVPEPWASNLAATVSLIDTIDAQIVAAEVDLRRLGADHPYIPLLITAPGIAWVLGYTIASEIGDIARFATPKKLAGYTGLCPKVYQSGGSDHRGSLSKNGPKYLRWALVEAAIHACTHPAYAEHYLRTRARLGRQRGRKVARIELARKLSDATWYMLTRNEPFNPTPALKTAA